MLGLTETLFFYLLMGIGVGAAVLLQDNSLTGSERLFRVMTAVAFWPIYVPVLLQRPSTDDAAVTHGGAVPESPVRPHDEMDSAIEQVETELDAAVKSLGGWAENVLAREDARFSELRVTWRTQADRIRELDSLLLQPDFVAGCAAVEDESVGRAVDSITGGDERIRLTEDSRRENIVRLRAIRRQMHDDLLGTLAWVRELVTMIHLAKFTGAPASRGEELVAQIAAAVQGLSEVAEWRDETELQMV
ncbi:MAG: hypothetical protein HON53_21395 [Planctomycetaceae bacterium]|nr:hypothetical protein [Planctomycetaceae bacterium]MBT6156224.1 hypothetical protein [Planctomycetaceae bacterium]MBT6487908.1 hypothetical protein [Planctomycetaceae bacterium]MBT6494855.1 hypothetical protein [Planctomycetaceae bacterium]